MVDYIQTSILSVPAYGKNGMLADSGFHDILTGILAQRKRYSVAVVAANDAVYTITLTPPGGAAVPFVYTADADATAAEIVVGLRDLINAGTVGVVASGSASPLVIESTLVGPEGDFGYSDGTSGGGSLTETLVSAQQSTVAVGAYVCLDDLRTLPGPADYAVRLPRAAADITGGRGLGLLVEQHDIVQLPIEAGSAYATALSIPGNDCVNVLHEGRAWAYSESAIVKGAGVYARFASGSGGSVLGVLRGDDDSSTAALIPRAKALTSCSAGGIFIVEICK
jgi:hypothetical protein